MAPHESRLRSEQIRLWQDRIFTTIAWGLGLLGLTLPVSIILFLCYHGAQAINWDLLWQSPKGFPLGNSGGIRPAIEGSLALIAIGLTVALPFALGGAIYITEYSASDRLRRTVSFCGECLAGVPPVIYGLVGYSFLASGVRATASFAARRGNNLGLGHAADYSDRRL